VDVERRDEFWTPSGVRLRCRARRTGDLNWLFLPGGPGIGSESLTELVDTVRVPGTSWLLDLPGDGSNVDAPGAPTDPYELWPGVLLEAARAVPNPVFVGHSTGGMYLLSVPELEQVVVGLALVSTAPDATWMPVFEAMTQRHPLPGVEAAAAQLEARSDDESLRAVAVASAPWNFTPAGVEAGAQLLARMPYNLPAVEWSAESFDRTYAHSWWPHALPTLVVSGGEDRIVDQSLWDDTRYTGPHVLRRTITGGAHFPWIEQPDQVRAAFVALTDVLRLG